MGQNSPEHEPQTRKTPRLKSTLPNRPGFWSHSGEGSKPETSLSLDSSKSSDSGVESQKKLLKAQEADLLRYAGQLERREQEISKREAEQEEQALKISEQFALIEARKKLLKRKEERLHQLEEESSHSIHATENPTLEPPAPDSEQSPSEQDDIVKKQHFINSCEELLLRKSHELAEKEAELDQIAEELEKLQKDNRK